MADAMEAVRLEGITKRFGETVAVDGVSLVVQRGEFVCLLGPSGCGKTTTLRMVAGFVEPDEGTIFIAGRDVTDRPPNRRDLGMVYQSYALFPHMTVAENVAFGLRMRGVTGPAVKERVERALTLVALEGLESRKPGQLSGGQQQRVALARAIVIQPTVLLLDEPLSNLDAKLRKRMQIELKALQRTVGITTIHVTHDQEEALTLADRLVILNHGRIEQVGTPREVYNRPRGAFVADFLGRTNFLNGRVTGVDPASGALAFTADSGDALRIGDAPPLAAGTPAKAFIRPERVELRPPGDGHRENTLAGQIEQVIFSGSVVTIEVRTTSGGHLVVERPSDVAAESYRAGDKVAVVLPAEALRILADG
jgi:putative spermidine/putrescine transport system ATP-binding protein